MAAKPKKANGYHTVTPYLVVHEVAKLIDFLKQTFGAKEKMRMQRSDGAIMHAEVTIGDSTIMMGEPMAEFPPIPANVYVHVADVDTVYRRALEAGATSLREPADQFYGDRNAGVKDSTGNSWWIATHKEDVPPDELRRRAEALMQESLVKK